mgnify:CR=1 FL=1
MRSIVVTAILVFFAGQLNAQETMEFSKSVNSFNWKFYQEIKEDPVNIIYSPHSISSALALPYNGAKGTTKEEMSDVMAFDNNLDALNASYHQLSEYLNNNIKSISLNIANALWAQKNLKLNAPYLKAIDSYYEGELNYCNFAGNPEEAREEINNWVEKKTANKIQDLLKKGSIERSTRLVLVNAIYFNAPWQEQFEKERNTEETFYIFSKCKMVATYMHKSIQTRYFNHKLFQAVELPYKGGDASMLILLPKERYGLMDLEKWINDERYGEMLKGMKRTQANVSLPKFKYTWEQTINDPLQEMGMKRAFSGSAEFSGITDKERLFIDKVIHKAFIDVNEEGTEAAAATAVVMRKTAIIPETTDFKVDHPFLFIIKENRNNTILFAGRVLEPKYKE